MKTHRLFALALCGFCLVTLPLLRADSLPEAMPVLKAKCVGFSALRIGPEESLATVAARSEGRISLLPAGVTEAAPPPMLTSLLPENIVYCRVASFQPPTGWPGFCAQLARWMTGGAQGIVLDLRSSTTPDDFAGAARLAALFLPTGSSLFTLRDARQKLDVYTSPRSPDGPPFVPVHGPVVVLVDRRTSGAAESLAACLQENGALVIGQRTMGRGASFAEQPLPSGQTLRYEAAEVLLPDGRSLWNHPVVPDISSALDDAHEKQALALIGQNRVLEVIREAPPRQHMSEAALARNEDPGIDSILAARPAPAVAGAAPVAQDVTLIEALDSLKAIRLSERSDVAGAPSAVQ